MVGLGSEQFCLHFVQFFENGFAVLDGVTWFVECGTDEKIRQRHVSFLCAPEEKLSLRRGNAQGDGLISCSVLFGDHNFVLPKYFLSRRICINPRRQKQQHTPPFTVQTVVFRGDTEYLAASIP